MRDITRDPDKGYLDSVLWVPKKHVNLEGTKRALSFMFTDDRGGVTTLELWKETRDHLLLPREFWEAGDLPFPVVDTRPREFEKIDFKSKIILDFLHPDKTTQRDALASLLSSRGGILQLACGKGKTIVALEFASRLQVPTLVIVGDTQLLDQWRNTILGSAGRNAALGLTPDQVGLIQANKFDWKKPIVLATFQTLANLASSIPEEVRRWFGLIIWDEAHHIAAPTFARSADLFYGYRLGLTATPTRDDGLHVIYDFHLGKVIHKDLIQELRPRITFLWTGFSIDMHDHEVRSRACDKNGELHNSRIATYFGQWKARLQFILNEVKKFRMDGRKVLVLSNSIDELVNLLAMWTRDPDLFTDIPRPTAQDVGETEPPVALDAKTEGLLKRQQGQLFGMLRDPLLNPMKREHLNERLRNVQKRLKAHEVWGKVENELRKREKQYLAKLLDKVVDAGLMIADVPAKQRTEMLRTKDVIFAITKYGREGLDEDTLDTILVLEPMSSRNGLQQVMGRILRKRAGKKEPHLVFLEDDIGPLMHMCKKLRRHLRDWPTDEGGPYDYELVGHPLLERRKASPWMRSSMTGFGRS